jgi:hypothetical protein
MKQLILLFAILFSLNTIGQRTTEVSANIGTYYFWTPKSFGHNLTFSGTAGLNLKDKYVISGGLDLTKAYYDTYPFVGIFGEAKRIFKKETASPYVAIRYGGGLQNSKLTGNYFSPGVGIIEHFENIDLQFSFNLKNHDHYSLGWVHGYEMRLGIIFKN